EDGRIVVVNTGTFTLRTADAFDTGLYHCIGTNHNDADSLTFRITVVDPDLEHNSVNGARLSTAVGSTLDLPCTSSAVPDAAVSWVLPERVVLHHSVRNKQIFDNGTLRIQGVTERDRGYYRCVAANQYGVDLLVFQVLVGQDETSPKEKQAVVGEWEEGDSSGDAALASATTQKHPSATLAASAARQGSAASAPRNRVAPSARESSSYGKVTYRHYRDKVSRRLRGHRRQFVSSARRVDPQRWAAFLERAKRNSTSIEKRAEVATKPPVQVRKLSQEPGDEEETSGDLRSPEDEFMIPVAETTTTPALGRATASGGAAGPEVMASNTPARKTPLLTAEAVTPPPSPFPQSVSSDSRRPQTYVNPTITALWESSDLSQISTNGRKQPATSNGASRTSTLSSAGQRLAHSGESNNQHFKSESTTPTTDTTDTTKSVTSQHTGDNLRVFTESIDKSSTKMDHQIPAVTASEQSPEFHRNYFHRTQKQAPPKPPLTSTLIAHQQMQIIQDVTTHSPQAQQQYGRRRKISGRRRIVRPGRIPSMEEHRYGFGRPGSVRGNTAVAADVQLNMKYVSNLPTVNNGSGSVEPFSPEAPLSSPSTVNMPLEHQAGTPQNTVVLREEENEPSARQKAAMTVTPFVAEDTRDTAQKLGSSPPFQTNTDGAQTFSTRLPTAATHTAHTATETAHTLSTDVPSTLPSVLPSIKLRTSPENSQSGKTTWEHLFGNGAQKLVPKKLPKQRETFPSAEASTTLPDATAALAASKTPPRHFRPLPAGGNHSSTFVTFITPVHYGSSKSEERPPTAEPHSRSHPATAATQETDGTGWKPTAAPLATPQAETRATKSKTFRVGRRRGLRRKRPPKTSTSRGTAAARGTAAMPSLSTATPVPTNTKLPGTPAEPPTEGASSVTEMLWVLNTTEAPGRVPTAATQAPATPLMWRKAQSATTLPPSPSVPLQPTARPSKPPGTSGTQPYTAPLNPQSDAPGQSKAGATVHPGVEEGGTQENTVPQPTLPAGTEPSAGAPAASALPPAPTSQPKP
ncbi:IGS10 protein, partial [Trogon melanurus]|nr:IGS10 protein [Trogon melanurus]